MSNKVTVIIQNDGSGLALAQSIHCILTHVYNTETELATRAIIHRKHYVKQIQTTITDINTHEISIICQHHEQEQLTCTKSQ